MESLLSVMKYPGMTLKGFILFSDESFLEIRDLVNDVDSVRTLDSVLLEVTKNTDKILHTHQVVLVFGSVDKVKDSACYRSMGTTSDPVPSGHRSVPDHHFTG
jgi:hypothetical protein